MSVTAHANGNTELPAPFDNSPFTPYPFLHVLELGAGISYSKITQAEPDQDNAKLHTFDSLLVNMPVSHVPYQTIGGTEKRQKIVQSEYCAHVRENIPGCTYLFKLTIPGAKADEEIGSCLLKTGSVILDTQIRLPYVAMQVHTRKSILLQLKKLSPAQKRVLDCGPNQITSRIPACDVKMALVMPQPSFFWDLVEETKKNVLNIRKITKNSYRLDHHIGSLNVSLQTAQIGRALPDALFLTSDVLDAMDPQTSKTIFRPKPLKRYLGIRRREDSKQETK
jgi:hypothetical protein